MNKHSETFGTIFIKNYSLRAPVRNCKQKCSVHSYPQHKEEAWHYIWILVFYRTTFKKKNSTEPTIEESLEHDLTTKEHISK